MKTLPSKPTLQSKSFSAIQLLVMCLIWMATLDLTQAQSPGSLAADFLPDPDGTVTQVVVLADGKVLICGEFKSVGGANGRLRQVIARINSDGSVDSGFKFQSSSDSGSSNGSCALRSNGKVALLNMAGQLVCSLNEDGSQDVAFKITNYRDKNFLGVVAVRGLKRILVLPDDRVMIAGGDAEMAVQGPRGKEFITTNFFRLTAKGDYDNSLKPKDPARDGFGINAVTAMALQADGQILIAGQFLNRRSDLFYAVIRVDQDGRLKKTFWCEPNERVDYILPLPDGKVLIGGAFLAIGDLVRNRVALLNGDGSVDATFNPSVLGGTVRAMALQQDGKIVIGGYFNSVGNVNRENIARVNSDGTIDTTFICNVSDENESLSTLGGVHAIAVGANKDIFIGGRFTKVNEIPRRNLALIKGK